MDSTQAPTVLFSLLARNRGAAVHTGTNTLTAVKQEPVRFFTGVVTFLGQPNR